MSRDPLLEGVCCKYCTKSDTQACPVMKAAPWSRWSDFCGQYIPYAGEPNALTLAQAVTKADKEVKAGPKGTGD